MSLEERFKTAVENINKLPVQPSQADLLEIYALYKQATVGDVNTSKPGFTDFKGKVKWDAWNTKKGISKEDAMEQYTTKAASLGVQV